MELTLCHKAVFDFAFEVSLLVFCAPCNINMSTEVLILDILCTDFTPFMFIGFNITEYVYVYFLFQEI